MSDNKSTTGDEETAAAAEEKAAAKIEAMLSEAEQAAREAGTPASDSAAAEDAPTDPVADELEKLKRERDENYNRYLRAVADLDNYRRRVLREKDELRQFAVRDLVESLIPVLENLGLAIDSANQTSDPKTIATGVFMVRGQFQAALDAVGLVEIKPEPGAEFDPHQHESLSHTPSDTIPEEGIAQLVRVGFSLNGRLIRPASVVLSGGPAQEDDGSESATADRDDTPPDGTSSS